MGQSRWGIKLGEREGDRESDRKWGIVCRFLIAYSCLPFASYLFLCLLFSSVVFAGFSAKSLRARIEDSRYN